MPGILTGTPRAAPRAPFHRLLRDAYDAVDCPTLVLRGETFDLLFPDGAAAMACRGPRATITEITGCGHAPALNVPDQIDTVQAFLGAA